MRKFQTSYIVILLILLVGIGYAGTTPAHATTTFNVTDAASLIQAIENANDETNYPGADIIDLGGNTITFSSSYADYNGATALPQITSEITLQNGTLDGSGGDNFRLLAVGTGGGLTLQTMTLQNGGGNNFTADGGALYSSSNNPQEIYHTFLKGNSGNNGGAIASTGALLIANSVLTGNVATNDGGAIYVNSFEDFSLFSSTVAGNSSSASGNVISVQVGQYTIISNIIWGNTPSLSLTDSIDSDNVYYNIIEGGYSQMGGIDTNIDLDPRFTNPIAPSNVPTTDGEYSLRPGSPAIDAGDNSAATDADSTPSTLTDIAGNSRFADDPGMPDTGEGTAPIIDMGAYEFQGNSCANVAFPYTVTGGESDLLVAIQCANNNSTADTIDLDGQTITLSRQVFVGKLLDGINFSEAAGLPLIDSEMTIQNGTLTVDTSSVRQPSFGLQHVVISENGTLTLQSVTLRDGDFYTQGSSVINYGILTIIDSVFANNTTRTDGSFLIEGGSVINYSILTVIDSVFANNTAGTGGAIFSGGAGVQLTIRDSIFHNNTADLGGAVYTSSDSTTEVTNSLFYENSALTNGDGGAIWSLIPLTVTNSTFTANNNLSQATNPNGTIYIASDGAATLTNNILWNNTGDDIATDSSATATVSYSIVEGGFTGTGNLDADPIFVDAANDNYALSASSPAIDAASNTAATDANISISDLAGFPRFADDTGITDTGEGTAPIIDMGAYEFQENTTVDETPPIISLNGEAEITLEAGDTFTDPGATATDNVDGDLTDSIVVGGDTVDTSTLGTYVITYNVTDSAGNAADEVTRTVTVADTTPPTLICEGIAVQINLSGDPVTITADDLITEASDNVGIVSTTLDVDTFTQADLGSTIPITVTVADAAGNETTCTVDVLVTSTLDVNTDGIISPTDAIYVLNRVGSDDLSADVDGDGDVDTDDVTLVQDALGTEQ